MSYRGFSGALGVPENEIQNLQDSNLSYIKFLLVHTSCPNEYPNLMKYDAHEYARASSVKVTFPIYEELFKLEDELVEKLKLGSVRELHSKAKYTSGLNSNNLSLFKSSLTEVLNGNRQVQDFKITLNEYSQITKYWETLVNRI